jgi:hypothetical protein
MQTNQLKNYLRVLYKQGVFTGDLNPVQQFCLNWALMDERDDLIGLEEEKMKYTILAGNLDLYKSLYLNNEHNMTLADDEWQSMEEVPEEQMSEIFSQIEAWESQRDEL